MPHEPIDFRTAVELAVRRTSTELVVTRWSDSGYTPADTIPGDPEWAGGATLADHQTVETTATRAALYEAFARIGGANGYYVVDWAWRVRGLMDRAIGGPGLRRGRRHPVDLRPGESLDFWRVRTVERRRRTRSRGGDEGPGRAWLSWRIAEGDEPGVLALHQTAWFAPRGLWGRAYWYAMLPFHVVIFAGMARSITRHAEADTLDGPRGSTTPRSTDATAHRDATPGRSSAVGSADGTARGDPDQRNRSSVHRRRRVAFDRAVGTR